MSINAVLAALKVDVKPSTSKLVLIHLADRLNDKTGQCNPSVPTLAADTGLGRKSVSRALWKLREKGLIDFDKNHRQVPNYRLCFLDPLGDFQSRLRGLSGRVKGSFSPSLGASSTPQPVRNQERTSIEPGKSTRLTDIRDELADVSWAQ